MSSGSRIARDPKHFVIIALRGGHRHGVSIKKDSRTHTKRAGAAPRPPPAPCTFSGYHTTRFRDIESGHQKATTQNRPSPGKCTKREDTNSLNFVLLETSRHETRSHHDAAAGRVSPILMLETPPAAFFLRPAPTVRPSRGRDIAGLAEASYRTDIAGLGEASDSKSHRDLSGRTLRRGRRRPSRRP